MDLAGCLPQRGKRRICVRRIPQDKDRRGAMRRDICDQLRLVAQQHRFVTQTAVANERRRYAPASLHPSYQRQRTPPHSHIIAHALRPIHEFHGVSFMLADMATGVEAGRELCLHAARLRDAGEPFTKQVSVYANVLSYGTGTFEGIRAFWNPDHEDQTRTLAPGGTWQIPASVPHHVDVGPDGRSLPRHTLPRARTGPAWSCWIRWCPLASVRMSPSMSATALTPGLR